MLTDAQIGLSDADIGLGMSDADIGLPPSGVQLLNPTPEATIADVFSGKIPPRNALELAAMSAQQRPVNLPNQFGDYSHPTIGQAPALESIIQSLRQSNLGRFVLGPTKFERQGIAEGELAGPPMGQPGLLPMALAMPQAYNPSVNTLAGKALTGAFVGNYVANQPQRMTDISQLFSEGETGEAAKQTLFNLLETIAAGGAAFGTMNRKGGGVEVLPPEKRPTRGLLEQPAIDVEEILPPAPRQLPGPRGRYVVTPTGQAVDLDQLSPMEQAELMRGPRVYTPRESRVRPAQAAPVILGEQPPVNLPEIITDITKRPPPEGGIVPVSRPTRPPLEPSGGEVSFRAPAEAQGIPNALQQAQQFIPRPIQLSRSSEGGTETPLSQAKAQVQQETNPEKTIASSLPALIKGERLVTIERPDKTTYTASFGDKYWDIPSKGRVANVGRVKEGTDKWSHGPLEEGEKIIEIGQPKEQNAREIRSNQTELSVQKGQEGQETVFGRGESKARGDDLQRDEEARRRAVAQQERLALEQKVKPQVEKEKELRGPFALSGPRIAVTPDEIGFKDTSRPVDALQLRNRLKNKLTPTEWSFYEDKLPKEGKISPDEAAKLMQESGPQVKVESYGMEGKVSEAKKAYDQMTHEWFDNLSEHEKIVIRDLKQESVVGVDPEVAVKDIIEGHYNAPDMLHRDAATRQRFLEKALKYKQLFDKVDAEPMDTSPRATSAYSSVSAFPTDEPMPEWTKSKEGKNVQRVDVVIPLKEKDFPAPKNPNYVLRGPEHALWQPDNLHENLPNTLGWAMIQYKTGPKGEKIAFVSEAQSRWGQERRNQKQQYPEARTEQEAAELRGRRFYAPDHPLLRDYNRLILKAAIEQAKREGATHIVVSDAETAMMTEGHDINVSGYNVLEHGSDVIPFKDLATMNEYINTHGYKRYGVEINEGRHSGPIYQREDGKLYQMRVRPNNEKGVGLQEITKIQENRPTQEPGMRLNYDTILPKIMEELTGQKGERVSLGEHKNALRSQAAYPQDTELYNRFARGEITRQQYEAARENQLRPNLIFRNSDGTPKTDVSGLMFDISKTPEKFSMFEKDRPEARATRLYMNPLGAAAGVVGEAAKLTGKAAKGVGKAVASGVRLYSEPMIERLARKGGPVAKQVSKEAGQIVSHGKQLYGELTSTLDPAKKAVGAAKGGTTWLRELNEVTSDAAYNNFFGQNEGAVTVPPKAQRAVGLSNTANRAIGQMATRANPDFTNPTGKLQRILTGFGYDVVLRGSGPAWEALAHGLARLNNKPLAEVKNFLTKWKAELDQPTASTSHLDKISQDFVRKYPRSITHVKSGGAWHEVLVADPFNYLEAAAQRTAHAVAFREVYPLIRDPATGKMVPSGLLEATRKAVQKELKTDKEGSEFDNLIRALQGHPLDVFTKGWNAPDTLAGGAYRMAGSLLGTPLKTLMLSGNFLTNVGEVVSGGPSIFLGFHNVVPAMKELATNGALYGQLEAQGMVNRALYNMAHDPSSPIRSTIRQASNLTRKVTGQQFLNEVQEAQAAASAKFVADRVRGRHTPLTQYEQNRMKVVARAMGFTKTQAEALVNGDAELLSQFETKASAWLTAGNQSMGELSRLGASRAFNSLFWFHRYSQMTMNQLRAVTGNLVEDVQTFRANPTRDNFSNVHHGATLLARLLGGRTLQGAILTGILAGVTGWIHGLKEKSQEAKDEPFDFLLDSFLAGQGGPLAILRKLAQNSQDANTLESNLVGLMPPVSLSKEFIDASFGTGRYRGKNIGEKIGGFLDTKTPGMNAVRTGLAVVGLSETDLEFQTAMKAFYRWRKEQPGYLPGSPAGGTDEEVALRNQMKKVRKLIENGGDWVSELKKVGDDKAAARSLYAGTLLELNQKPLSEDQLTKLRKHIGSKLVDKLQTRDAMIREVARTLGKGEVEPKPTGQRAMDFETDSKRSEKVKQGLRKPIIDELARLGITDLSYSPDLKPGKKEQLLSVEESKVMQEVFTKTLSDRISARMTNLAYSRMSLEGQKAIMHAELTAARQLARSRTKSKLREEAAREGK